MSTDLISMHKKLENGRLPVLDATLEQFNELSEEKTTRHQHLAEIIRSDIGFTLAIFRSINMALPAGRDPVANIEHAISMNGVPRTLSIGEELVRFSTLPEIAQSHLKNLYSQAMHASQYCKNMTMQMRLPDAEMNSNNVKMMNLAEVLLWTNEPGFMSDYQGQFGIAGQTVPESLLNLSMRGLGLALASKWKLPDDLQQALAAYNDETLLPKIMITATEIARQTADNWHTDDYFALLNFWHEQTEIPIDRFESSLHQLAAETARQIHGIGLPQPAYKLFFEAPKKARQDDKTEIDEGKFKTNKKKPVKSNKSATVAKKTATKHEKKTSPLQNIMTDKMRDIQKMCGVNRVMFAMLNADRTQLSVRFALGGSKEDALRKYRIAMSEKTLCSILMSKPQSVHLKRSNYKKYLQLIPEPMQQSINCKNLFAMSLFVKDKPVGLFLCDSSDGELNTNQYNNFKNICNQAADLLSGKKK
jgi:HD-like signal output (HDOD) protein